MLLLLLFLKLFSLIIFLTLRSLFSRLLFEPSREDLRLLARKDAKCKQGLVQRCEALQKQRRAVESEVQKDGGTISFASLASEAKIGPGVMSPWTERKDGKQSRLDVYFGSKKR